MPSFCGRGAFMPGSGGASRAASWAPTMQAAL